MIFGVFRFCPWSSSLHQSVSRCLNFGDRFLYILISRLVVRRNYQSKCQFYSHVQESFEIWWFLINSYALCVLYTTLFIKLDETDKTET